MTQKIIEAPHPWPAATADAKGSAELWFGNGALRLAYSDMSGVSRKAQFSGVVGVRWTLETAGYFAGLRDDFVYEVLDSEWVRGINELKVVSDKPKLRHYVIGFNEESSWLEVVFESWTEV
jgi:hypothetical protein